MSGILYATYMLGMVNENDLCYLGGFPAENLKSVFGIWNEEIDTLYPGEKTVIGSGAKSYEGEDYSELIHTKGASVIATYNSEFYAGMPAATVNHYGSGKAYYQALRDAGKFWGEMVSINVRQTEWSISLCKTIRIRKLQVSNLEIIILKWKVEKRWKKWR